VNIGKRLRQIRVAKGLSQRAIEKRSGILRPNISHYESGDTVPMLNTVEKWAKALGVPLWEVFAEAEVPSEPAQPEPLTPYEKRLFGELKKLGWRDRALFKSVANKMASQGGKDGRK
jgi:transcriptional regulator with XRE-family HTH domain